MISGYGEKIRLEVIQSGIRTYEIKLRKEKDGVEQVNKPKNYLRIERAIKKRKEKHTWFKNGNEDYVRVLFVPPTPGSQLQKEMQKKEMENNQGRVWRIKVVEEERTTIKNLLQRSNPWSGGGCQSLDCFSCTTSMNNRRHN